MPALAAAGLAVALPSAALMGLAIQRGATCMVAAVDEIVTHRRASRALALGEAASWVAGALALASLAGLLAMHPAHYLVTAGTVFGGVLLGIGAWVNRACVFGAIARLGSGQWAYAATPLGFFLGCLILAPLLPPQRPPADGTDSFLFTAAAPFAITFAGLLLWRLAETWRAPNMRAHLWHPHRATLLIAVTFVTTLLTVGAWAYTDALADLARAMTAGLPLRLAMAAALIAGAIAGGWIAGLLRAERPRARTVLRCLLGGMLMGWGGMLVPGSNDGLILIGLPLLLPHAWVAVSVMALSIAAAIRIADHAARAKRSR